MNERERVIIQNILNNILTEIQILAEYLSRVIDTYETEISRLKGKGDDDRAECGK